MKKQLTCPGSLVLCTCFILVICCHKPRQYQNTRQLLQAMKKRNDGNWFQYFSFKQKTLFFDENEKIKDSAIWFEQVSYPYLFRIDRDLENGNYSIYRNDSTYHILSDTLYLASKEPAKHLLFKGGLYFISLEETLRKFRAYGYDTSVFNQQKFNNQDVYVIGDKDNQIWLHADYFYCVRRISTNEKGFVTDVIYDNFKRLGTGWVEQKVTFYVDSTKRMEEFYYEIKELNHLDREVFTLDHSIQSP